MHSCGALHEPKHKISLSKHPRLHLAAVIPPKLLLVHRRTREGQQPSFLQQIDIVFWGFLCFRFGVLQHLRRVMQYVRRQDSLGSWSLSFGLPDVGWTSYPRSSGAFGQRRTDQLVTRHSSSCMEPKQFCRRTYCMTRRGWCSTPKLKQRKPEKMMSICWRKLGCWPSLVRRYTSSNFGGITAAR